MGLDKRDGVAVLFFNLKGFRTHRSGSQSVAIPAIALVHMTTGLLVV